MEGEFRPAVALQYALAEDVGVVGLFMQDVADGMLVCHSQEACLGHVFAILVIESEIAHLVVVVPEIDVAGAHAGGAAAWMLFCVLIV